MNRRAGRRIAAAVALTLPACAVLSPGPPLPPAPPMDAARIARDVAWLADDAREGRGPGTRGLDEAARYLADGFRSAGFAPGAPDGSYFQEFELPVAIRVAREVLRLDGRALEPGRDFAALLTSADGSIAGPVVFAGYGISAPELGYDDYAGLEVEGSLVLVLDDRPAGLESPLAGRQGAGFLRRAYKISNARDHGAAGVLLVSSGPDAGEPPGAATRGSASPTTRSSGILLLGMSRDAAERLLAASGGPGLAERQAAIDAGGQPASARLGTVRVEAEVEIERVRGRATNVIAIQPGADPLLGHEVVVVGAHYDHLGRGEFGSLAPDRRGEVHNGADDNASGSAGLLELARAFGREPPGRRTLLLAAFAGEELGLLGSREYVENPGRPLEQIATMVNLDMIGRLEDGRLIVFGTSTSPGFSSLVARAVAGLPLELVEGEGGYAPSDQTSFYARDVPSLFFFTGTHAEYHTPDDDAALVDAEGTTAVLRAVYRVVAALRDVPRPRVIAAAPPQGGSGPGYGPYLGTVPDFAAADAPGVRLQAVRAGSPAERAGLRAGDRIVGFDGASIANLEEYSALLFGARPGQRVEIEVIRDGERIHSGAILGQRR